MMLRTRFLWIIFGLLCWLATPCVAWDDVKQIPLSTLDLSHMSQGWGRPVPKGNVVKQALRIAGKDYQEGVGTHAVSVLHLALDGQVLRFTAEVGIDESAGRRGSVRFQIYADRRLVF
ncbi:MAG TPA: NPCBM/NEW2 domain-containing protein, partial [Thermogutta sp.]|nr:NPCBM/NEW2 domain-containing protein [Thermogutta sp.]